MRRATHSVRYQEIQDMRSAGLTTRQIAVRLGITPNGVLSTESKVRQRAHATRYSVRLTGNTFYDISREAGRRGLTVDALCDEILSTVAKDGLFAAVLD